MDCRNYSADWPVLGSVSNKGLRMTREAKSENRTYRRDDGAVMIEVRPGQFISENAAAALGLLKQSGLKPVKPANEERARRGGRLQRSGRS
jgi:hypothetical protein